MEHRILSIVPALSALLISASGLVAGLTGSAHANKPLIGVVCGDGFFVRAPTQKIYWIHGDPLEKTVVYDGPDKLAALAECGGGVAAVFQDAEQPEYTRTFFSGDCRNLGQATENTRLVHEAAESVARLSAENERLVIGLASGATHDGTICRPDPGSPRKQVVEQKDD